MESQVDNENSLVLHLGLFVFKPFRLYRIEELTRENIVGSAKLPKNPEGIEIE